MLHQLKVSKETYHLAVQQCLDSETTLELLESLAIRCKGVLKGHTKKRLKTKLEDYLLSMYNPQEKCIYPPQAFWLGVAEGDDSKFVYRGTRPPNFLRTVTTPSHPIHILPTWIATTELSKQAVWDSLEDDQTGSRLRQVTAKEMQVLKYEIPHLFYTWLAQDVFAQHNLHGVSTEIQKTYLRMTNFGVKVEHYSKESLQGKAYKTNSHAYQRPTVTESIPLRKTSEYDTALSKQSKPNKPLTLEGYSVFENII